ncbi:hypothetical protein [Thermoactinospora rubra]|uniref:hypothetical protein n=1 Tax=Thermoactinospora rubra TaxID=1088767 RepID=UPI000A114EA6|nr:hypothetical protein [Thermoactinospora rubra]
MIPPHWQVAVFGLAALAAPALRTAWWYIPEGPTFTAEGFVCPLSAEPYDGLPDVDWLIEINWRTMSAELDGWPTVAMALGLLAD